MKRYNVISIFVCSLLCLSLVGCNKVERNAEGFRNVYFSTDDANKNYIIIHFDPYCEKLKDKNVTLIPVNIIYCTTYYLRKSRPCGYTSLTYEERESPYLPCGICVDRKDWDAEVDLYKSKLFYDDQINGYREVDDTIPSYAHKNEYGEWVVEDSVMRYNDIILNYDN